MDRVRDLVLANAGTERDHAADVGFVRRTGHVAEDDFVDGVWRNSGPVERGGVYKRFKLVRDDGKAVAAALRAAAPRGLDVAELHRGVPVRHRDEDPQELTLTPVEKARQSGGPSLMSCWAARMAAVGPPR